MEKKTYAVITGASKGLGFELAFAGAQKGLNLILISLPGEGVKNLSEKLSKEFNISVVGFEVDLTDVVELNKIIVELNKEFRINMLINNAGIGGSAVFDNVSVNYIDNILMLNIRALAILTHGLMSNLKKNRKAYILNIASMASFGPMPYKTVYPASKAFVYSFSRGLSAELAGYNINVSVAHPGGMATNPEVSKRIEKHNLLVQKTILSPDKVAKICINGVLQNNTLIIPGFFNKLSYLFFKIIPVWLQLIIFRLSIRKEISNSNIINYA